MATRWQESGGRRGEDYDAPWREMANVGENIHGEADLVQSLLTNGQQVLDAGCGTGRVAIELARRGFAVTGVDSDDSMLATARQKAPELRWVLGDLACSANGVTGPFDLALLAGNVMIFLEPGTEEAVLHNLTRMLAPGGMLVTGFSLLPERLSLRQYDRLAAKAGLRLSRRWSTWDRCAFNGGDYAVSVHRRP